MARGVVVEAAVDLQAAAPILRLPLLGREEGELRGAAQVPAQQPEVVVVAVGESRRTLLLMKPTMGTHSTIRDQYYLSNVSCLRQF